MRNRYLQGSCTSRYCRPQQSFSIFDFPSSTRVKLEPPIPHRLHCRQGRSSHTSQRRPRQPLKRWAKFSAKESRNAVVTALYIQDPVDRFDSQTAHISFVGTYFHQKADIRIDGMIICGLEIQDERWQNDQVLWLAIRAWHSNPYCVLPSKISCLEISCHWIRHHAGEEKTIQSDGIAGAVGTFKARVARIVSV